MSTSMDEVRAALDPEEPDYSAVASLGEGALPHLAELASGEDPMLASKAVYAASLIGGPQAAETVRHSAQSEDPVVRVAAAAAASNLDSDIASEVLESLVGDTDPGVRKVARSSVPEDASEALTARIAQEPEDDAGATAAPLDPSTIEGLMPGEHPSDQRMPGESDGLMPGEAPGDMPR